MKNFMILTESINYIEANLCEPITREEIAGHCFVSLSQLEKLFRYALHLSIKEYVSKRRMTQAAKDIRDGTGTITDIAMKYQYNSVEVFSRSFKRVWNILPSEFNEHWKFTGIFPRINYHYQEGEELYMARKRVDFSDAYEYLRSIKGSYVLCFDMQNLTYLNDISRKLGDIALLEEASRIDKAASEDMVLIRIGGDEFALITGLYSIEEAKKILDEVLAQNGNTVTYEGAEYPVSLWCGIAQIPEQLRYSEFFVNLHEAINHSKT